MVMAQDGVFLRDKGLRERYEVDRWEKALRRMSYASHSNDDSVD